MQAANLGVLEETMSPNLKRPNHFAEIYASVATACLEAASCTS
jgi:hypothetical protein